jgi:hypothetical protein
VSTIKRVLSDEVTMIHGFEDGHVEVSLKFSWLPIPVTMRLDENEIPQAIDALGEALTWNSRRPK